MINKLLLSIILCTLSFPSSAWNIYSSPLRLSYYYKYKPTISKTVPKNTVKNPSYLYFRKK